MIGKIPKAGRGFAGLVRYLTQTPAQKNAAPPERLGVSTTRVLWTETTNLLTDNPAHAVRIMRATANHSARCKAPAYHFVISWPSGTTPDKPLIKAIVEGVCTDMGLDELQRLVVAHDDTNHRHVHVVLNRVHPITHKAWNRAQDWVRLEQSLKKQADTFGMPFVPGRHNSPDTFAGKPKRPSNGAFHEAKRKGLSNPPSVWSLDRIRNLRPTLITAFASANTWTELHSNLASHHLSLSKKGGGLVITEGTSDMKLSKLAKPLRLASLEARFRAPFNDAKPRKQNTQPSRSPTNTTTHNPLRPSSMAPDQHSKPPVSSKSPPSALDSINLVNDASSTILRPERKPPSIPNPPTPSPLIKPNNKPRKGRRK